MDTLKTTDRLLITLDEAAQMTSVGRTRAYRLVASGEWPSVRIGRSIRIPVEELRTWIQQKQEEI